MKRRESAFLTYSAALGIKLVQLLTTSTVCPFNAISAILTNISDDAIFLGIDFGCVGWVVVRL